MSVASRIMHAWNAFSPDKDLERAPIGGFNVVGPMSSDRPDRPRMRINSERTIISSIYTRMSIDVASVQMEHCRVDENGMFIETIDSAFNDCLKVEANLDQGARHFRQDIALSLFQHGAVAIVPVDTVGQDPLISQSWDIKSMRVGPIIQWAPQQVQVRLYDERDGINKDIWLPKKLVAIVENPFYATMNEPNSTLQRLIRKLSMLDNVDEIASQGKLDIIIQLPYVVKSETRKNQAKERTKAIQEQLQNSTYGIAYTDGTEKITQLNRSVENNLLEQIKILKAELFNELGLTEDIMNGTADDVTMLNYVNRTIEPVMDAITEAMLRKFITKTARTQGQSLMYFQAPFKLIPISQLADIVDVLSRNQIVTPNEIRPTLGLKPSTEPQANTLVNSNMPLDQQITGGGQQPLELNAAPEIDPDEAALDKQMADLGLA